MKKTTALRNLLFSNQLEFLMEAHNGLTARIVAETGFRGIWASGLTISASQAKRDANELTSTEVFEIWERMCDAVNIPMLVDADTGGVDFNAARTLISKCERIGVAGICLEDQKWPKQNSLMDGRQKLADVKEHSMKIRAMRDTAKDSDFVIVARLESFIAGTGLQDALERANAYIEAGADAILVHSKKSDDSEIESFIREFNNRVPIVIVPTKYYTTPTEKFRSMNVSIVIWANHLLRAAIPVMQNTAMQIFKEETLINVEDTVATVKEIFRLQNDDELRKAEEIYLKKDNICAIILAATKGEVEGYECPKTMIQVGNESIIHRQIRKFKELGVNDIIVVSGYESELLRDHLKNEKIQFIENEKYYASKEGYSLSLVKSALDSRKDDTTVIVSFGDVLYKSYMLHELLKTKEQNTLVADVRIDINSEIETDRRIRVSTHETNLPLYFVNSELFEPEENHKPNAEFIGLSKFSIVELKKLITSVRPEETFMDILYSGIRNYKFNVMLVDGGWSDINSIKDLANAK